MADKIEATKEGLGKAGVSTASLKGSQKAALKARLAIKVTKK